MSLPCSAFLRALRMPGRPLSTNPRSHSAGSVRSGVSHSTMSSGDYVLDGSIPKGPGRSDFLSTANDSRIAAHMAAQMSQKVSVVIQVDSEYHTGNSYAPEVEFVNVKYALTPDASVRVGRIALPTFLESENRDVGYTYAWIHPPVEVYRQEPVTHGDGVRFQLQSACRGGNGAFHQGRVRQDHDRNERFPGGQCAVIEKPVGNFRYAPNTARPPSTPAICSAIPIPGYFLTGQSGRMGEGQRSVRRGAI